MARPPKLTPEIHKRIVDYVLSGAYIETAAAACGISKQTLYNWLRWGQKRNAKEPYKKFAADLQEALAHDEMRGVIAIERIAGGGTTKDVECPRCKKEFGVPMPTSVQLNAVQWKLERKYPDRYGGLLKIEHKIKGRIEDMLEKLEPLMSRGAYDELLNALGTAMGEPGVAAEEAGEQKPSNVH